MNKKALTAVTLVIMIPLISYQLVKHYSEDTVVMPRRFYSDSIKTTIKDGKEYHDTVWHKVGNITLTNQMGEKVSLDSLHDKIIIADFIFTRCPSICPTLTSNMKKMQEGLKVKNEVRNIDTTFVQFLSFSVDPERDSVPVLKKYAEKYGVNPDNGGCLPALKKRYTISL